MSRNVVFLYSGQGSQYYQMGRELWQHDPIYRAAFERYDAICGPVGGQTLSEILFAKPLSDSAEFDRLAQTHPLILAMSLALTDVLEARGVVADQLLGYSLGETTAAVVSGVLSVEEAFWALRAQASVFERLAPPGALIAVLTAPDRALSAVSAPLRASVELAAINAPQHCVLAVPKAQADAVCADLSAQGLSFMPLPVRFAFHSSQIDAVFDHFSDITQQLSLGAGRCPVWSCALAGQWHAPGSDHFWTVARKPVRFAETIPALLADPEAVLVDVGPSGTLAGLVKLNGNAACKAVAIMNQFGRDLKTLNEAMEFLQ